MTTFNIFSSPYSCPTNGTSDCSTAINAAIAAAEASVGSNIRNLVSCAPDPAVSTNSVRLTCNSSITVDPYKCRLDLGGAQMFFPNNGTGLIIAPTNSGNTFGLPVAVENGLIQGANAQIGTNQTLVSIKGQNVLCRDLQLTHSGIGFDCSFVNAYLIRLENCFVDNMSYGFRQVGSPSNSGENIQIVGGCYSNCTYGIDWQNSNGGLWVKDISVDAFATVVRTQAGPVRFKDCHFETSFNSSPSNYPIECSGTNLFSEVIAEDCEFVYTTANTAPSLIDCSATLSGGVQLIRPRWGGTWTGNTNNISTNGGGIVAIRQSMSQNQSNPVYPPLIDLSNTWNVDPNLSQSKLVDAWAVTKDTAVGNGPLNGIAGSLSLGTTNPRAGTQAIAAVKRGSGAFAFGLYIPCDALDNVGLGVWYRASANSLGTVALNIKYVNLQGFIPSQDPFLLSTSGTSAFGASATAQAVTLTPTTTYQQETTTPLNTPAPSWASHVLIEFDMASMAAGTLYIGAPFEIYRL